MPSHASTWIVCVDPRKGVSRNSSWNGFTALEDPVNVDHRVGLEDQFQKHLTRQPGKINVVVNRRWSTLFRKRKESSSVCIFVQEPDPLPLRACRISPGAILVYGISWYAFSSRIIAYCPTRCSAFRYMVVFLCPYPLDAPERVNPFDMNFWERI